MRIHNPAFASGTNGLAHPVGFRTAFPSAFPKPDPAHMNRRSASKLPTAVLTALMYVAHLVPLVFLQEDIVTSILYISSCSLAMGIRIHDVFHRNGLIAVRSECDALHERIMRIHQVVLICIIVIHCVKLMALAPTVHLCLECVSQGITGIGLVLTIDLLYKISILRLNPGP